MSSQLLFSDFFVYKTTKSVMNMLELSTDSAILY